MSGVMDSPLMEALVFNCGAGINIGVVLNNLWTWVAVLTAAVSFWRIRSFKPDQFTPKPDPIPVPSLHAESNPVQKTQTNNEPDQTTSTSTQDDAAFERLTKGNKYKAYYGSYEEERETDSGDLIVVEEWSTARSTAAMKIGELAMGWYSYQDTNVLDGSVVRLWDHCCLRRCPSLVGVTRIVQDCN